MFKIDYNELKNILKGLGVLVFYLLASALQTLPLDLINIDITQLNTGIKIAYLIIYQFALISIIVLFYKNHLIEKWKDFKINNRVYFNTYFKYWLLMLVLMMASNALINIIIPDSLPANEEAIRSTFKLSPVYIYISAVIIAPILEELVFRLNFRFIFKSNILFIIMSGLMFGSLHVLNSAEQLIELLYLIPYSIPGFIFAYVLTKTDNIFTTIGLHFIHNGVLISLQFLVMFLS